MSDKVLTPNVFITNNYEDIQSFFLNPKKIGSLQDLSTSKGSLLISGKNNKYLQFFELSYNFDSSDTQKLILEFVDTDGNFEQSFFLYPLDQVKSLLNSTYEEDQYIRAEGSNIESKLIDISDYASQIHRIYVSFGVGSNLRDWSDPMAFQLREVKLDISKNGLRKYQFNLFPSNGPLFRPKLVFNFNKPNPSREFFLLDEANPTYIATIPASGKYTLEIALYKLIKNYLAVLTQTNENNIIGILPKLLPVNNSIINGNTVGVPGDVIFDSYQDPSLVESVLNNYGIQVRTAADAANAFSEAIKLKTGRTLNPDITRSQIEAISRLKNDIFLQLEAKRNNSTINPGFPDFYEPLNKINTALKSNLNTVDDFVVIQENNSKILKFFKDQGLISDDTSKCIIFGFEAMINEWLYRNYIPDDFTSIRSLEDFSSRFKSSQDLMEGKEKSILSKDNYGIDYLNFVNRKKLSSAFSEKINIDELSYDQKSKQFTDLFKDSENILKLLDIPVFTNNLKNSNILDLSIQNSEVYYNSFKKSIESNFTRFYLSNIQRNISKLNIKGLQLTSIFDQYKKILDELYRTSNPLTSKTYRQQLKEAMIQAFYFAKESNSTLPEYPVSFDVLNKLSNINYDRDYINKGTYDALDRREKELGISREEATKRIQKKNLLQLKAEILAKTGTNYIDPERFKRLLNKNSQFFSSVSKLFIKNGGNIDIDSKLLLTQAIIKEASRFNQVRDDEVEIYYDLAGLLTTLFDVELSDKRVISDYETIGNFMELNPSATPEAIAGAYDKIYYPVSKSPNSVVFKPKNLGLGQDNIAAELWRNITEQAYKISIKTLPFFHLSSYRSMVMKPCYLFSKKITVSRTNPQDNSLDFFSGTYNITAFRHVINTRECYSQFLLVKSVGTSFLT
jgi:hypothetical protein